MSKTRKKAIPVCDAVAEWRQDPAYLDAENGLEDEFSIAAAVIAARVKAGLTQAELAKRMGTTQSAVARLEGGSRPSTATLAKIAAATGTKLKIAFEPA